VTSPWTGQLVGQVSVPTDGQVEEAVAVAYAAHEECAEEAVLPHSFDYLVSRQQCMGEESIVDDRCLVAIAPDRVPGTCCRIADEGDLKSFLYEVSHMGLDAHVCQHAAENNSLYAALA
jgi:hypothetical protein